MLFNSLIFFLFFAVVYGLYLVLPFRQQNLMLLGASYLFYGWWDWRFLGLIVVSTLIDYFVAIGIEESTGDRTRWRLLLVSVIANLGMLACFKYANFFVESCVEFSQLIGLPLNITLARIVLPVGISFYTFQTMSYTIDVYRGDCKAERRFTNFALFVTYFPQLVAGPIERARVLLPQIAQPRTLTRSRFEEGCWLILSGYYLKVVVADNLSQFSQRVFSNPHGEQGAIILVATYAAAFQIYGDFAGYSNIARGISKLMGIELMQNFERPFFATSPSDFWRRWHISLSTWLRDYLYIPLGGNRSGTVATYRNLLLTMILGGLWHGAAWNFIAWGTFHGVLLCLWRAVGSAPRDQPATQTPLSWKGVAKVIVFFHLICFGWLLFFVRHLSDVPVLIQNCLLDWRWNGAVGVATLIVFCAPVMLMEFFAERDARRGKVTHWPMPLRLAMYSAAVTLLLLSGNISSNDFIYFQF